ncbi:hypothetical protein M9H77_14209 [Catharanthus roseus]|uniref:Uncharacterized protein n=1 Tax=Catharanthus roseus TaxID=4058 RepID=A0ACC0BMK2_CATRO|nr:hypothetical protein M9H77_14209 [Catharanthus roseus]
MYRNQGVVLQNYDGMFSKYIYILGLWSLIARMLRSLATSKSPHLFEEIRLHTQSARPNHCNTIVSNKTETTTGKGIYLSQRCWNRQWYTENGRRQAAMWNNDRVEAPVEKVSGFNGNNKTLRSRPQTEKDHQLSPYLSPLWLSLQKDQKRSNKNTTRRPLSETASQKTKEVTRGEQQTR